MSLGRIPLGMSVHCLELVPGRGAKVVRTAAKEERMRNAFQRQSKSVKKRKECEKKNPSSNEKKKEG